jgi:tetratricopeptide (TPR) repeat protein
VEAARRAAGQALTLDSGSAQAHTVLGVAAFYFDWDFTAAGELFEHAVALDPGYAEAHHWYAGYLSALERHSDALYQEVLARRLDPRSLTVRSDRCWYLLFAGRAREARAECRATLELEPHHHWALQGLVEATAGTPFIVPEEVGEAVARYWALHGEPEGAVAALSAMEPEAVVRAYRQWQHRRWEGREEEEPPAPPVALAMARAGVGDLEGAFAALERALETRDPWLVFLDVDPRFDPLQDDRRFFELRRKVGLPSR